MSVMLSLLSWFLLAMAAGGGLHTNLATAEVTIASNSAAVTVYWHTMLPNTLMPSAILELLTPPSGDFEKDNFKWKGPPTTGDVEKDNFKWKFPPSTDDVKKDNFKWKFPPSTGDIEKDNFKWKFPPSTGGVEKDNFKWKFPPSTDGVEKDNFKWKFPPSTDGVEKDNFKWKFPPSTDGVEKDNFKWKFPPSTDGVEKDNFKWKFPPSTDGVEKDKFSWGGPSAKEIGESHIGQHKHIHGTASSNVVLEEALKPGTAITCYILPSHTSGAPLLRRDVADAIPMSRRNFADIMTMFAPASNGMAADIWSTLERCEYLDPIKGEMKRCATSVESMVEVAASVLGVSTYNLRAFSSPDSPTEGIMPARPGYKVVAAARVTEAGDTVTCHGGRFPFAVFMCHTLNPTRLYSVTLEGPEDGGVDGAPLPRMELLALCHLDTSGFDPTRMPLHVKPGEAPLCHFLSRDSIVWAPAAPASGHAAA